MYTIYPEFFPSKKINSFSGVTFSNVVKSSSDIKSLYRGDDNLAGVIFLLPTLLTGIFCKSFPEEVNIEQIRLHKLTNLSNDFHMVSMSEDPQVGLDWGRGCFITIDPVLFSKYSVDVHASFRKNDLIFPGRMAREAEHTALAVPFCSIRKITLRNKEFVNPFYVSVASDNHEAIKAFDTLYCQLITLLRKKNTQETNDAEEKIDLQKYARAYLEFYTKFCPTDNPFNKSLSELFALYPEFMENFFQSNQISSKIDLLRDLVLNSAESVFKEHPYTKNIDTVYIHRNKVSTTVYEDDWAKPNYD